MNWAEEILNSEWLRSFSLSHHHLFHSVCVCVFIHLEYTFTLK